MIVGLQLATHFRIVNNSPTNNSTDLRHKQLEVGHTKTGTVSYHEDSRDYLHAHTMDILCEFTQVDSGSDSFPSDGMSESGGLSDKCTSMCVSLCDFKSYA